MSGTERIYVASSWRNTYQPTVVDLLRMWGKEVYDFRNPPTGALPGFRHLDPHWKEWSGVQFREALNDPAAVKTHESHLAAMEWADTCVLVLPSGRSASFEFGWCVGLGKRGIVFQPEPCEPELMYRGADIAVTWEELRALVKGGGS